MKSDALFFWMPELLAPNADNFAENEFLHNAMLVKKT